MLYEDATDEDLKRDRLIIAASLDISDLKRDRLIIAASLDIS